MNHSILTFIFDYLSERHLQYLITDGTNLTLSAIDLGLRNSILQVAERKKVAVFDAIQTNTIYHITDYYNCCYSLLPLPEKKEFLFVGPYLLQEITETKLCQIMEFLEIPNGLFTQLRDYYYMLPYIPEKYSFHGLLRHLYRALHDSVPPHIVYLDLKNLESHNDYLKKHQFFIPNSPVLSMHLLEKRYAWEDTLLDAVSHGNSVQALSLTENIQSFRFSLHSEDKKRTFKNLMLSFNTLLRRTAYISGVHPFYIDTISDNYADMIEQCSSNHALEDIIPYMIESYCNLVKRRSTLSYSEPVRQILVTIDASLTADLTLKRFSEELFLNTSYLSALFKKEVGLTLTDYVNKSRIAYAKKLLRNTTLSIQNIATQSGISDVHYFARLFRRETGMSPRKWKSG